MPKNILFGFLFIVFFACHTLANMEFVLLPIGVLVLGQQIDQMLPYGTMSRFTMNENIWEITALSTDFVVVSVLAGDLQITHNSQNYHLIENQHISLYNR